jgi:hypothetical protein
MARRRVIVLVVAVVIGTGLWMWHRAPPPGLEQLETELAACREAGMIVEAAGFRLPEIPEAENAAGDYMRAIKAMGTRASWPPEVRDAWGDVVAVAVNQPWSPDDVAAAGKLVTHCATTLSLLHEGALKPYCHYAPEPSGMDWASAHGRQHIDAARLLRLASRLLLERGRAAEAVSRCGDLLQLRRGLANGSTVLASVGHSVMTGHASKSIVLLANRSAIPPPMCRSLGNALPTTAELTASLRRGINGDWVLFLEEIIRDLRAGMGNLGEQWLAADVAFTIRRSRLAWQRAEHPSHVYRTLPPLPDPPEMTMLSKSMAISYDTPVAARDTAAARADLTRTVLDLELRRAEGGAYDAFLQELTSGNWRHVEADPFTGKPYRCEWAGEGYRLWSAGGDGRDDGGDPERDIVVEVRTGRPAEAAEPVVPAAGAKSSPPKTGADWRQYWQQRRKERSRRSAP